MSSKLGRAKLHNTQSYYLIQSIHRKNAVNGIIDLIRRSPRPPADFLGPFVEIDIMTLEWAIETFVQGAIIREYHHWETDTKKYFADLNEPIKREGHEKFVERCLERQDIAFSDISVFADVRKLINSIKHKGDDWATSANLEGFLKAVSDFWGMTVSPSN